MTDGHDPSARRRGTSRRARRVARKPRRRRIAPSLRRRASAAARRLAIDVAAPSPLWRDGLPGIERLCAAAARAALAGAGALDHPAELSIVLGDDRLLRSLNKEWRGQDKPTNVLSFPAGGADAPDGAPRLLGDVVLAFETVHCEAAAQGKPLAHHLRHLVVHGVLHLLGFDHETAADARRMEALETAALARLGVPDPYRSNEPANG